MRSFGLWISLCSCAAAARMQIVVTGAFLNTGAQAAIEMRRPYLFLVWDRPDWPNPPVSTASLHPLHVHDSAVAIISVHPSKGPGRCGYAATSLSPPPLLLLPPPSAIIFCCAKCNQLVSFLPSEPPEQGTRGSWSARAGVMKKEAPLGH